MQVGLNSSWKVAQILIYLEHAEITGSLVGTYIM